PVRAVPGPGTVRRRRRPRPVRRSRGADHGRPSPWPHRRGRAAGRGPAGGAGMFTGIVEELGRLRERDGHRFVIAATVVLEDAKVGDSVSHNGCCLTVVEIRGDGFSVAVIPHTAEVTTLGRRKVGDRVNLEVDLVAKYLERLVASGREA